MELMLIGDLHVAQVAKEYGEETAKACSSFFTGFIEWFLAQPADFHISVGDITNNGFKDEFKLIFDTAKKHPANFIQILGNHDAWILSKQEWRTLSGHPCYHAIDTTQAKLLFLDTSREKDTVNKGGYLDQEQLRWLKHHLSERYEKPIMLFAHHPVFDTTARSTEVGMSIVMDSQIKRLLQEYTLGQGFYINGHNHINSIYQEKNWCFLQSPAVLDVPCARKIKICDTGVHVESIYAPAVIADLRIHFIDKLTGGFNIKPLEMANGKQSDQQLDI